MSTRHLGKDLPPFAEEYLAAVRPARRMVRWFHVWLKRNGRPIRQLEPREVALFLAPILAAQKPPIARAHRRRLIHYLDWLRQRDLLLFDPRALEPRAELPPLAGRFTNALKPTHKPATVSGYCSVLRHFHIWLDAQPLTLDSLDRTHVSAWLQWLHARNLSACHRVHSIAAVRAYFRWLEEQSDYTGKRADDLFRRGDFPKLPQYLPRPVPDDLDGILQRRLGKSHAPTSLGLLLMRRTGMRVGEMSRLPLHCVHSDHRGRHFLKVPLGKLDSERLVPLDPKTLRLIERLRVVGSAGRRGRRRTLLLEQPSGKPIRYDDYRGALKRACRGLVFAEPMTSHRLRHTYATSMLAAGVSLPVLMKLLGHRDYRMTLRYAAITIETVTAAYVDAIENIEQRYSLKQSPSDPRSTASTLADLARYVLKQVDDAGLDKRHARTVVQRLRRLDTIVQRLLRDCARRSARSE